MLQMNPALSLLHAVTAAQIGFRLAAFRKTNFLPGHRGFGFGKSVNRPGGAQNFQRGKRLRPQARQPAQPAFQRVVQRFRRRSKSGLCAKGGFRRRGGPRFRRPGKHLLVKRTQIFQPGAAVLAPRQMVSGVFPLALARFAGSEPH